MYHEEVIKLNHIWNSHIGFNFERKNELPYKKNRYITFGSFNNYLKISDDVVETWTEILKIPNSKLLLKSSNKFNEKAIIEKFNKHDVKDRLIILDYCKNHEDHLMQYQKVDIVLDTLIQE